MSYLSTTVRRGFPIELTPPYDSSTKPYTFSNRPEKTEQVARAHMCAHELLETHHCPVCASGYLWVMIQHITIKTKDLGDRIVRIADIHMAVGQSDNSTLIYMNTPVDLGVPKVYQIKESFEAFKERLESVSLSQVA